MVFDTRTLSSFSALAGIIGEYTTPSKAPRILTQEQQDQACRLRKEFGWHAQHIAEAIGLAPAQGASNYTPHILEALVGCTTRGGWGGREIGAKKILPTLAPGPLRDRENRAAQMARDRLNPDEATVEGTNRFGALRGGARANAIIEAALAPERLPFYGEGARKAGYQRNSAELAADADIIIRDQKYAGHYPGIDFTKVSPYYLTQVIDKLVRTGLFVWEGSVKTKRIEDLPEEERKKIDAEILRRLKEQAEKTPTHAPSGFFSRVRREVYATFKCCGPDGDKTMEQSLYPTLGMTYVNKMASDQKIFGGPQGTQQVQRERRTSDPKNQKAVKDAIGSDTYPNVSKIARTTGFTYRDVEIILKKLGYATLQSAHVAKVRAILLPLHDKKLTPSEIWDQSPELRKLIGAATKSVGTAQISDLLRNSDPPRVPWTQARKRTEQRAPQVASNIRATLLEHLKDMLATEERFFGRLYLPVPSPAELAQLLNEPEPLVAEATGMLLAEESPIIQIIDGVIVIPNNAQSRFRRGELS